MRHRGEDNLRELHRRRRVRIENERRAIRQRTTQQHPSSTQEDRALADTSGAGTAPSGPRVRIPTSDTGGVSSQSTDAVPLTSAQNLIAIESSDSEGDEATKQLTPPSSSPESVPNASINQPAFPMGNSMFPNPLPPPARNATPFATIDPEHTSSAPGDRASFEDGVATELCGSPRRKRVDKRKSAVRSPFPGTDVVQGWSPSPLFETERIAFEDGVAADVQGCNPYHLYDTERFAFDDLQGWDPSQSYYETDPIAFQDEVAAAAQGWSPSQLFETEHIHFEDGVATELCGSPRLKKVDKGKSAVRSPLPSTDGQAWGFPYSVPKNEHISPNRADYEQDAQEPTASFNPEFTFLDNNLTDFYPGLARATLSSNIQLAQSHDATLRHREAIEQLQSQSSSYKDDIAGLQADVKSLTEDLRRQEKRSAKDICSLKETLELLRINSDCVLASWEGMRRELLDLKVSQEKIELRVRQDLKPHSNSSSNISTQRGPRDPPPPPTSSSASSNRPTPKSRSPPNELVFEDRGPSHTVSNIISRLLPNPEPASERRREKQPPLVFTRIPAPVVGPGYQGDPPAGSWVVGSESVTVPPRDRREKHIRDNPKGCRWSDCVICWGDGERRGH